MVNGGWQRAGSHSLVRQSSLGCQPMTTRHIAEGSDSRGAGAPMLLPDDRLSLQAASRSCTRVSITCRNGHLEARTRV